MSQHQLLVQFPCLRLLTSRRAMPVQQSPPFRHGLAPASGLDSSSDALPSWDAAAESLPTPTFAVAAAAAASSAVASRVRPGEEGPAAPERSGGAEDPGDWSEEWEGLCLGGAPWVPASQPRAHASGNAHARACAEAGELGEGIGG